MRTIMFLLFLTGCVDTVGPFVTDVHLLNDGSIRVTRCTVELTRQPFTGSTLRDGTCDTKRIHAP